MPLTSLVGQSPFILFKIIINWLVLCLVNTKALSFCWAECPIKLIGLEH